MTLHKITCSLKVLLPCLLVALLGYWFWQWNRNYQYVNAARQGNVAAVQRYLRAGVPVDVESLGAMTAMRWACYEGHADVVRVLLAHGADPNGGLFNARQMHRPQIVALLKQAGAKG